MPGRVSSRVFVGRSTELADLQAAYQRAGAGAPSAILIGGDAGVGKTRLIGELASSVRAMGGPVLEGHCADLGAGAIPLLPVTEALRAMGPLPAHAPAELVALGRGMSPGAVVFAPMLEFLRDVSTDGPVLLVIEDVHWADRSTLDLLTFLVSRLRDERLLLVVSHRSDEVDQSDVLRRFVVEAARRPCVQRLRCPS